MRPVRRSGIFRRIVPGLLALALAGCLGLERAPELLLSARQVADLPSSAVIAAPGGRLVAWGGRSLVCLNAAYGKAWTDFEAAEVLAVVIAGDGTNVPYSAVAFCANSKAYWHGLADGSEGPVLPLPDAVSLPPAGWRGKLVVCDNAGNVLVLAADGTRYDKLAAYPEKFSSPPAVDGDRVYVGTFGKVLHCLDAASGKTLWSRPLPGAPDAAFVAAPDTGFGFCTTRDLHVHQLRLADGVRTAYGTMGGWATALTVLREQGPANGGVDVAIAYSTWDFEIALRDATTFAKRWSWRTLTKPFSPLVSGWSIVTLHVDGGIIARWRKSGAPQGSCSIGAAVKAGQLLPGPDGKVLAFADGKLFEVTMKVAPVNRPAQGYR